MQCQDERGLQCQAHCQADMIKESRAHRGVLKWLPQAASHLLHGT